MGPPEIQSTPPGEELPWATVEGLRDKRESDAAKVNREIHCHARFRLSGNYSLSFLGYDGKYSFSYQ